MTQIEINFSTYMPSGATFYTYFSILQSLDKPSETVEPLNQHHTSLLELDNYI